MSSEVAGESESTNNVSGTEKDDGKDTAEVDGPTLPSALIPQIADHTGFTDEEVKDAIHDAKEYLPRGTGVS